LNESLANVRYIPLMDFVTDFADQAVILPLVAVIAAILAIQGWYRGALAWLLAIAGTFGMVFVLKLGFLACPPLFGAAGLSSPSGHAAAATVVTGGLVALLTSRLTIIVPVTLLVGAVIGYTRLALGVHSLPEVGLAVAIGLMGVFVLARLAGVPPDLRLLPIGVAIVVVVVLLHGARLPAEGAIRSLAHQIPGFLPACRAETMTGSVVGRLVLAWGDSRGVPPDKRPGPGGTACPAGQTLP